MLAQIAAVRSLPEVSVPSGAQVDRTLHRPLGITSWVARPAEARVRSAAGFVPRELGADAPVFLNEVNNAFLSGLSIACIVSAGVTIAGALFVMRAGRSSYGPATRTNVTLTDPASATRPVVVN